MRVNRENKVCVGYLVNSCIFISCSPSSDKNLVRTFIARPNRAVPITRGDLASLYASSEDKIVIAVTINLWFVSSLCIILLSRQMDRL